MTANYRNYYAGGSTPNYRPKFKEGFAGAGSLVTRYLTNFTGGHATIQAYTFAAGDVAEMQLSLSSNVTAVAADQQANDANRLQLAVIAETFTVSQGASGGEVISVDGGSDAFTADGVIKTVQISNITPGMQLDIFGQRFDGAGPSPWEGVIKTALKITNAGIVKHNWQLDTNTGYFIDKANPIADIYRDTDAFWSDYNAGGFTNGVDTSGLRLTGFTNALQSGKYRGDVTSDWTGVINSSGDVSAALTYTGDASTVAYTSSNTPAEIQSALENPNLSTLDFNGGSFTDATMAQLRQDAGDPVGVITGSVEYIQVKQLGSYWVDPAINDIYVDDGFFFGDFTNAAFTNGVRVGATKQVTSRQTGGNLGKYDGLYTNDWSLSEVSNNGTMISLIGVTSTETRAYTTSSSDLDILADLTYPNILKLDFTPSGISSTDLVQLRQDAGDTIIEDTSL